MGDFTRVLDAINAGDREAIGQEIAMVYPEMRELAHRRLRKYSPNTLPNTTSLVHECYLKITRLGRLKVEDRDHFVGYAARAMRSIVVDFARERLAQRNGSGAAPVTLPTDIAGTDDESARELLAIDDALEMLARTGPRLVQVVEMRHFAGYGMEDIARTLAATERTVRRDWDKARLLLSDALRS